MKILILINNKESYKIFSTIFQSHNFFDVDYSNIIPDNLYYDGIVCENSNDQLKDITETPIILLNNSMKMEGDNIVNLKNCLPESIIATLKRIYESNSQSKINKSLMVQQEITNKYFTNQQLILQIENNDQALQKIQKSLNCYNISAKSLQTLKLVICEFLIQTDLNKVTIILEFNSDNLKLSLPTKDFHLFSIQNFCQNIKFISGGLELQI